MVFKILKLQAGQEIIAKRKTKQVGRSRMLALCYLANQFDEFQWFISIYGQITMFAYYHMVKVELITILLDVCYLKIVFILYCNILNLFPHRTQVFNR